MKFNALRINSAPDVLVEEIISQIDSGKLTPGECLPSQRELAKLFNVGLGSVREAIKILDVRGYVNVVRGKGTFITEPSVRETDGGMGKAFEASSLADLIAARKIVEGGAAGMAAAAGIAEHVKTLRELADQMDATVDESESGRERYYELDFQFHLAVAEASGNSAIVEMIRLLVNKSHSHVSFMSDTLSIAGPNTVAMAVKTARTVVAAIEAGDVEASEAGMRRHLDIVNMKLDKKFPAKK
ncbi:MAG: FCD domain-containing protein [Desulfobacterales bacterium]|nr:FCD domain-containing protein [Desulfobacterales bacterium]